MRIVIPVSDGKLATHFGHCQSFSFTDIDPQDETILAQVTIDAPAHEPGVLPTWLAERNATLVLAGGMGSRAVQILTDHGIEVLLGVPALEPEVLVLKYLDGEIGGGPNDCNH